MSPSFEGSLPSKLVFHQRVSSNKCFVSLNAIFNKRLFFIDRRFPWKVIFKPAKDAQINLYNSMFFQTQTSNWYIPSGWRKVQSINRVQVRLTGLSLAKWLLSPFSKTGKFWTMSQISLTPPSPIRYFRLFGISDFCKMLTPLSDQFQTFLNLRTYWWRKTPQDWPLKRVI